MNKKTVLSALPKTWIFDLDGTVLVHNGYKINGRDRMIDGACEFLREIPEKDTIIFLTSREKRYKKVTEDFLEKSGIRWDYILYDIPCGERILFNDAKPSGLPMAYAVNIVRNVWPEVSFEIDNSL